MSTFPLEFREKSEFDRVRWERIGGEARQWRETPGTVQGVPVGEEPGRKSTLVRV